MIAFTRRQLRHTACLTLFAWMFALLSGVANAWTSLASSSWSACIGFQRRLWPPPQSGRLQKDLPQSGPSLLVRLLRLTIYRHLPGGRRSARAVAGPASIGPLIGQSVVIRY